MHLSGNKEPRKHYICSSNYAPILKGEYGHLKQTRSKWKN